MQVKTSTLLLGIISLLNDLQFMEGFFAPKEFLALEENMEKKFKVTDPIMTRGLHSRARFK